MADSTTNGNFQIYSSHDNYFSYNNSAPIAVVKHIHGQYNCTDVQNVNSLQNQLSSISGSPNISIINPKQDDPLFNNVLIGGFELSNNSPLIDAGIQIQGFYDFNGLRPDVGAKESTNTLSINENTLIFIQILLLMCLILNFQIVVLFIPLKFITPQGKLCSLQNLISTLSIQ